MYHSGCGVAQNYGDAMKWFREAADAGDAEAMTMMGRMYAEGNGTPKSDVEALKWFRAAADAGDPWGMVNLGFAYEEGSGVPKSLDEAREWYRQAAEKGLETAKIRLEKLATPQPALTPDELFRQGKERFDAKQYAEALPMIESAASAGHAQAATYLGFMFQRGHGVRASHAESETWYRKAAAAGDGPGMYHLAYLGSKGHAWMHANQIVSWFRKAADAGVVKAMYELAVLYDEGRIVSKNSAEATAWYLRAAEAGNADAKTRLAEITASAPPQSAPVAPQASAATAARTPQPTADVQARTPPPAQVSRGGQDFTIPVPGIKAAAFSQNGRVAASFGPGGVIQVWDLENQRVADAFGYKDYGAGTGASMRFTTPSLWLSTSGRFVSVLVPYVRMFIRDSETKRMSFDPGSDSFNSAALSRGRDHLAILSVSEVGGAHLTLIRLTGTQEKKIFEPRFCGIRSMAVSPLGDQVALAGDDSLSLFSVGRGVVASTMKCHKVGLLKTLASGFTPICLEYSPNGSMVASAGVDGMLILWKSTDGSVCQKIQLPSPARCITFNEAGNAIVTGGSDGSVRLWDLKSGQCTASSPAHHSGAVIAVMRSGNRWLSAGSEDGILSMTA